MHTGDSHKHDNSKGSEAMLGTYEIFKQRRRAGKEVLDFRSENGQFTGSWEERSTLAPKPLLGNWEAVGRSGDLANMPLFATVTSN